MRAGVRVAADHRHAGQGGALLRSDHVHDALAQVVHAEFGDAELAAVVVQRIDLRARDRVVDALARGSIVGTLWSATSQVGADAPRLAAGQA